MIMKAMSAADAKNAFGVFLDAVQHEPVLITKKNRPVGVMLSMQDIEALFGGDAESVQLALAQARLEKQLEQAREQVSAGQTTLADAAFFEKMRERIRSKYLKV
jgi:prevent-host-death family protein